MIGCVTGPLDVSLKINKAQPYQNEGSKPGAINISVRRLPISRMLPGSSPCELRLLLPDYMIGKEGFHDIVLENLSPRLTS